MDGLDKVTLVLTACLVVVALLFPLSSRRLPGDDAAEPKEDGARNEQKNQKKRR
ncbi:hypothetical protein [Herbaspirillum sp.]|uniref:hypothetical protein n=1 Tax=Herbaspirillum sp. TaxID=1890675 RepID=UPI0031D37585